MVDGVDRDFIKGYLSLYSRAGYSMYDLEYDKVFKFAGVEYKVVRYSDGLDFFDDRLKDLLFYNGDFYMVPVKFLDLDIGFIFRGVSVKKFFVVKFFSDFVFLYGYEGAVSDYLFVVEGIKDCLVLKGLGYNAVAILGNNIRRVSDFLLYLKGCGVKVIVIGDNDSGGRVMVKDSIDLGFDGHVCGIGKDIGGFIMRHDIVKCYIDSLLKVYI